MMHRTHMGVDQDYRHLMVQATRCALADGWSGSMISTDLQDIMFGTPVPVLGAFNLGVLKEDEVNVVVHGHEPLLPELLVAASHDPEIKKMAEEAGAKGVNLAGMCCSANEVLMRHGIPCAGNFLQQELALVTGAVEVMTVDVQCEMQGLKNVAECFHTKLITTSDRARIEGRASTSSSTPRPVSTRRRNPRGWRSGTSRRGVTTWPFPRLRKTAWSAFPTRRSIISWAASSGRATSPSTTTSCTAASGASRAW